MLSPPIYPEAEMYAFTYGSVRLIVLSTNTPVSLILYFHQNFNSMKDDIRSATSKLQEIRRPRSSSVPSFDRPTSCASLYDR